MIELTPDQKREEQVHEVTNLPVLPTPSEMRVMRQLVAELAPLVGTGFLPAQIDTPAKALAVILKGRELGVPPMEALSQLYVVNGRVTMQSQLMLALIARSGRGGWRVLESTADRCVVSMWRTDITGVKHTLAFTAQDAAQAGLLGRDVWTKYRPALLRARAISACARIVFPDVIGGLYTPEELDVPVVVNEEDNTIVVDAEVVDVEAVDWPTAEAEAEATAAPPEEPVPDRQPEAQEPQVTPPTCAQCGRPMRLRTKRADGSRFWGCTGYPGCKATQPYVEPAEPALEAPDEAADNVAEAVAEAVAEDDGEEDPFATPPTAARPIAPDGSAPKSAAEFRAALTDLMKREPTDDELRDLWDIGVISAFGPKGEQYVPDGLNAQEWAEVWEEVTGYVRLAGLAGGE